MQAELAIVLLKVGVKIKASDFDLKAATVRAAESARDQAEAELRRARRVRVQRPLRDGRRGPARRRRWACSRTTGWPAACPTAATAATRRAPCIDARPTWPRASCPSSPGCRRSRSVLIGALQAYEAAKDPKDQPRINAVLRAASALHDRLEETRWKVGDAIDYPFEHADEDVTLGKFAFPPLIPAKDDIGGLLEAAGEAINRLARPPSPRPRAARPGRRGSRAPALGLPPIVVEEPEKEAAG